MSFVFAFAIAVCLIPFAARLGSAIGLVDRPANGLKIHRRPVPVVGGMVVVAAMFAAMAATGHRVPRTELAAAALALLAGLLDDLKPLRPWVRIQPLVAAGIVLLLSGFRLSILGPLDGLGAVVLVLVLANAVNITDGRDGLVGGLGVVAALGMAALLGLGSSGGITGLTLAGALGGFLVFNATTGRIFLGNGGAYAVGVLLAVLSLQLTETHGWRGLLASAACVGVFAFELGFTVVRRIRSHRPLVTGDRGHSYDLIADRVGTRRAVFGFWAAGAMTAGIAAALATVPLPAGAVLAGSVVVVATAVGIQLNKATGGVL
jgi:UDP-GlcNAc:undecaprenyl-phosphate GlcNAc-1-phosphate transferase